MNSLIFFLKVNRLSFGEGGVCAWAACRAVAPSAAQTEEHDSRETNNMGVGEKTAGRTKGLTARRLTPSPHCPAPCKILPEGEEKTPCYRLPSCSWPGARYAVTEVGPARPILPPWHPAMERVTCRGGDRTALRNTSRVFLSALIRCCSAALSLWVSSRFHYLCLCLADAGCVSILLNPGWDERGAIPSRGVWGHPQPPRF